MALTRDEFEALYKSGLSTKQISSMGDEAARAELRGYRSGQSAAGSAESRVPDQPQPDPFGVGAQSPEIQYAPMGGRAYSGTPDQPVQEVGLNQLQTGLEIGTAPFLAWDALGLGGRAALGMARAPILRHFPGARLVRNIGGDIEGMVGKARAFQEAGQAAAPEAAAAESSMQPLVGGAEAAAYRSGGMPAVEAMRAQAATAAAPEATVAGSAAARVAPAAPAVPAGGHLLNPEEAKVVLDASRRRGFATLKEAGIQGDKAVNGFIKKALGRKIGSKADLNVSDWLQINKAADEAVLEAKAAIQAAARAGKATVAKVATKVVKPAVGAAASRVPAASEVPPGTLQRLSEMNLSPQELYDFWRQAAQ